MERKTTVNYLLEKESKRTRKKLEKESNIVWSSLTLCWHPGHGLKTDAWPGCQHKVKERERERASPVCGQMQSRLRVKTVVFAPRVGSEIEESTQSRRPFAHARPWDFARFSWPRSVYVFRSMSFSTCRVHTILLLAGWISLRHTRGSQLSNIIRRWSYASEVPHTLHHRTERAPSPFTVSAWREDFSPEALLLGSVVRLSFSAKACAGVLQQYRQRYIGWEARGAAWTAKSMDVLR